MIICLSATLGGFIFTAIVYVAISVYEEKNYYPLSVADLQGKCFLMEILKKHKLNQSGFLVPKIAIHRATFYNNETLFTRDNLPLEYNVKFNNVDDYKIVCYYNFPGKTSDYYNLSNVLFPEEIDPDLCTHINLAFVTIRNNSLYIDESQLNDSKMVLNLKLKNPKLKVLLSVGGAGNEEGFPQMVLNHLNRKQ